MIEGKPGWGRSIDRSLVLLSRYFGILLASKTVSPSLPTGKSSPKKNIRGKLD